MLKEELPFGTTSSLVIVLMWANQSTSNIKETVIGQDVNHLFDHMQLLAVLQQLLKFVITFLELIHLEKSIFYVY